MRQNPEKLKDGQALDRLIDQVERWARSYRQLDDETQLRADFAAKFTREAEQLAKRCCEPARRFGTKDWIVAVLLWLIIAGGVLLGSILLMRPDQVWFWGFVAVAAVIFVVGLGFVYFDTTSPARAERRLREKTRWLLGASRRAAETVVRERRAKRG